MSLEPLEPTTTISMLLLLLFCSSCQSHIFFVQLSQQLLFKQPLKIMDLWSYMELSFTPHSHLGPFWRRQSRCIFPTGWGTACIWFGHCSRFTFLKFDGSLVSKPFGPKSHHEELDFLLPTHVTPPRPPWHWWKISKPFLLKAHFS